MKRIEGNRGILALPNGRRIGAVLQIATSIGLSISYPPSSKAQDQKPSDIKAANGLKQKPLQVKVERSRDTVNSPKKQDPTKRNTVFTQDESCDSNKSSSVQKQADLNNGALGKAIKLVKEKPSAKKPIALPKPVQVHPAEVWPCTVKIQREDIKASPIDPQDKKKTDTGF